ncbi:uncharacterized protein [Antedon mediterranea]|uniref:uncharacterized protein isoform X1 n=1 Tax=Antedon mediterranea TaxID=105859 RepID=UPI003AF8EAE2
MQEPGWQSRRTVEYCDVGEINEYCPLDSKSILNPVGLVYMDLATSPSAKDISTFNLTSTCTLKNNVMASFEKLDLSSLTLTFYILPGVDSLGSILEFGNAGKYLVLRQTWSQVDWLYESEVTVSYDRDVLTRAYVLQPDVWTFIALTFNGKNKKLKLWRNGEIASIGYTTFTHLEFEYDTIDLFVGTGENLNSTIATVQVYDHVLNEVQMKAARDMKFNEVKFTRQLISVRQEGLEGQLISEQNCRSLIQCSQMCLNKNFCEGFRFESSRCVLLACLRDVTSTTLASNIVHYRVVAVKFSVNKK